MFRTELSKLLSFHIGRIMQQEFCFETCYSSWAYTLRYRFQVIRCLELTLALQVGVGNHPSTFSSQLSGYSLDSCVILGTCNGFICPQIHTIFVHLSRGVKKLSDRNRENIESNYVWKSFKTLFISNIYNIPKKFLLFTEQQIFERSEVTKINNLSS